MKQNGKLIICALALAIILVSGAVQAQQKPEAKAVQSAKSWLALVDAGKYDQSWDVTARYIKDKITKEQWATAIEQARTQAGALKSRRFTGTQVRTDPKGLPPGQYVAVKYASQFDKLPSATEVVAFKLEGGQWRVVGYFVRPA